MYRWRSAYSWRGSFWYSAAVIRIDGGGYVLLELWLVRPDEEGESLTAWGWHKTNGMGASGLRLATLPARLTASDPSVALPLALMDVPEIRARVEAL